MKKTFNHLLSVKKTHNDFKEIKKDKNSAEKSIYFSHRAILLSVFSIVFALCLLFVPLLYNIDGVALVLSASIILFFGYLMSSVLCLLSFFNTCYQLFSNRRLHGAVTLVVWIANFCIVLGMFFSCDVSFLF